MKREKKQPKLTREKESALKIPRRFDKGDMNLLRRRLRDFYQIDDTTNIDEYDPYDREISFKSICDLLDKNPDDYREHGYVYSLIKRMRDFVIREIEGWRQISHLKCHKITSEEYDRFIKYLNLKHNLFCLHGEVHYGDWDDREGRYRQLDYEGFELVINKGIKAFGSALLLYIGRAGDYDMAIGSTTIPQIDMAVRVISEELNMKEIEGMYKQKRKELVDKYDEYYSEISKKGVSYSKKEEDQEPEGGEDGDED